MMADETSKNAGDGMTVHHLGEGVTITINHEEEGDLVAILRIEEDQMARLLEEGDTTKTIVVIATGITVIIEEIDLVEIGPIDRLEGTITGVVIEEEEALEEMIIVVADLVVAEAEAGGDDDKSRREL